MERRMLGRTVLQVTSVCLGTSALGRAVGPLEILERALAGGVRFIDTANEYGAGASERLIGQLGRLGGLPPDTVVATKADPVDRGQEFSAARVRRSFEESCERLGVDRLGLFYLHDPQRYPFDRITGAKGALEGMLALRQEGLVEHLGVAGGPVDELIRYVDTGLFDVVLNHNRYTLLDRSAEPLISRAADRGLGFVNAAPFASGMLAKPPTARPTYQYRPPGPEIVARVARWRQLCDDWGVSLSSTALQFGLRNPAVSATVVGVSTVGQVERLLEDVAEPIPEGFWSAADGLPADP